MSALTSNLGSLLTSSLSGMLITFVAAWGFVSDFCYRALQGKIKTPYTITFLLEAPGAIFLAAVTYQICVAFALDIGITTAAVGIAGHLGAKGVYEIENFVLDKLLNMVK